MPAFSCPGCRKEFSLKEEFAGRRIKCPHCGTVSTAPSAARPMTEEIGQALYGDRPALGDLAAALKPSIAAAAAPVRAAPSPRRFPGHGPARPGRTGASPAGRIAGRTFNAPRSRSGQTSGMAVAAMVMGILGLVGFCLGPVFGILALIFGALSLSAIGRTPGLGGQGMAIAGIVMGLIGAAWWALAFGLGLFHMTFYMMH
jgi:hypothetical protein